MLPISSIKSSKLESELNRTRLLPLSPSPVTTPLRRPSAKSSSAPILKARPGFASTSHSLSVGEIFLSSNSSTVAPCPLATRRNPVSLAGKTRVLFRTIRYSGLQQFRDLLKRTVSRALRSSIKDKHSRRVPPLERLLCNQFLRELIVEICQVHKISGRWPVVSGRWSEYGVQALACSWQSSRTQQAKA